MVASRQVLLTPKRGGRPGRKIKPKALVIHWTANRDRGANAIANRNYFENHPQNKVSANWIVDDREAVLCVPEDEMAYHVGAKSYPARARSELSAYPNDCTIGVEICVNADADFATTYRNAVELAAEILARHGWGIDRLWRHYDVTGKDCPRFFVADATAREFGFESAAAGWAKFRQDVQTELVAKGVEAVFSDIAGHWAQRTIEEAAKIGLVAGGTDGLFHPDDAQTRAAGVVVAMRLRDIIKREMREEIRSIVREELARLQNGG